MAYRTKARRINRNPLRRVVSTRYEDRFDRVIEILECGHEQRERCDIYGNTCATRRRCRACGRSATAPAGERGGE